MLKKIKTFCEFNWAWAKFTVVLLMNFYKIFRQENYSTVLREENIKVLRKKRVPGKDDQAALLPETNNSHAQTTKGFKKAAIFNPLAWISFLMGTVAQGWAWLVDRTANAITKNTGRTQDNKVAIAVKSIGVPFLLVSIGLNQINSLIYKAAKKIKNFFSRFRKTDNAVVEKPANKETEIIQPTLSANPAKKEASALLKNLQSMLDKLQGELKKFDACKDRLKSFSLEKPEKNQKTPMEYLQEMRQIQERIDATLIVFFKTYYLYEQAARLRNGLPPVSMDAFQFFNTYKGYVEKKDVAGKPGQFEIRSHLKEEVDKYSATVSEKNHASHAAAAQAKPGESVKTSVL